MNDEENILALLSRRNLSAESLRHQLDLGHEQIYARLVHLEAEGKVEVVPNYRRDTCAVEWRLAA